MHRSSLTTEESATLESYRKIAAARSGVNDKPEFWRREFGRFALLLPVGRVLDAGCGSGRDIELFVSGGYGYAGADLCPEMLDIAKGRAPRRSLYLMDLCGLAFAAESFDGFWAVTSLLHLPRRRVGIALRELNRITGRDGVGFVVMKEGSGERMVRGSFPGDERFYAFYGLEEFAVRLEHAGFQVLSAERDTSPDVAGRAPTVWLKYYVMKR